MYKYSFNQIPKRYIVVLLTFFGLFNALCMRVNVSVAIVAMVNHTEHKISSVNTTFVTECPTDVYNEEVHQKSFKGKQYNWNPSTQGFILSAFFYGYILSMLPAGFFIEKAGAVRLLGYCILSSSIFTLLSPVVLNWGLIPFLILRFLEGFGEGAVYPCVMAIISRWSPILERSRITAIVMGGGLCGSVASFMLSGFLCSIDFLGGWPSVFYVFGTLGLIWVIAWYILIYDSPDIHPTISKEELLKFEDLQQISDSNRKVPWKRILTCIKFWAIVITLSGHICFFSFMTVEMPSYLYSVLHFNVKASGFLTCLPNIFEVIGGFISSLIADRLVASQKISLTAARKIFNSLTSYMPAVCLISITFSGCNAIIIILFLTIATFFSGFKYSGVVAGMVDISPNYAGALMGLANGLGNVMSIVVPTMIGAINSDGSTIASWSKVFYIILAVDVSCASFYAIFGSSEVQNWG